MVTIQSLVVSHLLGVAVEALMKTLGVMGVLEEVEALAVLVLPVVMATLLL
jgi:hypothetical protein